MDTNREQEHLDAGTFDESKALEALERMRDEIARYQALREDVNQQFERFVRGFKKPESAFAEATAHTPSPESRVSSPQPPVPSPPPSARAGATADTPSPELQVPSPQPPVPSPPPSAKATVDKLSVPLPPVAPDTPFEPPNLEPFARRIEGPRVEPHLVVPQVDEPSAIESSADELPDLDSPASDAAESALRQRVPTSPEAFAAAREDDEDPDATFAPAEAFDALPPPLPAIDDPVTLSPPPAPPRPAQTRTWALLGGIVIVAAIGAYMWMQGQTSDATVVEQPAPAPAGEQAPQNQAQRPPDSGQATIGSGQRAPAATQAAATLQTEIVTTQPAWVRLIADGERVIERELPANARIPFKAERTIQIRTGNAGAVRVSIRGKDQGPLGKIGEVVTRSFTVPAR